MDGAQSESGGGGVASEVFYHGLRVPRGEDGGVLKEMGGCLNAGPKS